MNHLSFKCFDLFPMHLTGYLYGFIFLVLLLSERYGVVINIFRTLLTRKNYITPNIITSVLLGIIFLIFSLNGS